MDIKSNLILLKGEDATDKISSCVFQAADNKWHITYVGNSKVYTPNRENLIWYNNPTQIAPHSVALYINGKLIADIDSIIDFGVYVRLLFKYGSPKLYHKNEISFDLPMPASQSAQNTFGYFR